MIVDHHDVRGALWRLGAPSGLMVVADQLLGIADTIVIGALGTAALAGITAATSVFIVFPIGLWAFANGLRIMGAQAIGAGDPDRFGRIVRAAALAPMLVALATALVSLVAARPLLHLMLGAIPSSGPAAVYLTLRCFSLLPMMVSNLAIAAFGAAGRTGLGLRTLIVINVVHIPLLIVLALGIGTHAPLGLFGAGLSSLIAECVAAGYCLRATLRRPEYRIFAERRIDFEIARAAAALSWPEFIMLVLIVVPEAITITFLAPLGVVFVAAYRALTLVSDLTWSVPGSLGDAIQIVIGQRLGARDIAGARAFLSSAMRIGVAACAAVGLVFAVLAWPLSALVTLNPALASLAAAPLALHMTTLPIKGYAMASLSPIRAAGDTKFSMWLGIIGSIVVITIIAVAIKTFHLGLYAIPIAWIITWSLRAALTQVRLRGRDWETRRLAAIA
ncbi:MAG: MATE family efflux transporter [Candidatus Eremiobacteraeota bacterium]|nr:MATE family efflux transporter [Candidatus Eremiobacteraeota bacterium]